MPDTTQQPFHGLKHVQELPTLWLCAAYLEAQAQVSLHIPAGKAQVLIALQAGCEPAVLQSLAGC